jgi:aerobic C4-dicarboxylate transport protein
MRGNGHVDGILQVEGLAVIFGVYRFLSMAIATCNTIGNSVATVVVAKWSGTFDRQVAKRHLYPERFPQTAAADAQLADGNLLPEDTSDENPHPTGIAMQAPSPARRSAALRVERHSGQTTKQVNP